MVFNETYQTYKDRIQRDISLCEQALIQETETAQKHSSRQLAIALGTQTVLIVTLVLMIFVTVVFVALLVFHPLEGLVEAISQDVSAEECGAYELRFVMRAYNKAQKESQQHKERLIYKATHDVLTDLYNREAFDRAREKMRGRAQAMFIFDVDQFKTFNDEYGHDMGDRVLLKVAHVLKGHFRDEDYVCRIGGDEFTVLMVHANSTIRPLVEHKLHSICDALKDTSDGLLPITLSIGVAFSDDPNSTGDLLKDADTALYITKERGKDGFTFYDDAPAPQFQKNS